MALNNLLLNGTSFFTIRGTFSESTGVSSVRRIARSWTIALMLETDAQETTLLTAMRGGISSVTFPDGLVASVTVAPVSIKEPHRPIEFDLTLTEILS